MKPLRGVRGNNRLGQSQHGLQMTENQWKGSESRSGIDTEGRLKDRFGGALGR